MFEKEFVSGVRLECFEREAGRKGANARCEIESGLRYYSFSLAALYSLAALRSQFVPRCLGRSLTLSFFLASYSSSSLPAASFRGSRRALDTTLCSCESRARAASSSSLAHSHAIAGDHFSSSVCVQHSVNVLPAFSFILSSFVFFDFAFPFSSCFTHLPAERRASTRSQPVLHVEVAASSFSSVSKASRVLDVDVSHDERAFATAKRIATIYGKVRFISTRLLRARVSVRETTLSVAECQRVAEHRDRFRSQLFSRRALISATRIEVNAFRVFLPRLPNLQRQFANPFALTREPIGLRFPPKK